MFSSIISSLSSVLPVFTLDKGNARDRALTAYGIIMIGTALAIASLPCVALAAVIHVVSIGLALRYALTV